MSTTHIQKDDVKLDDVKLNDKPHQQSTPPKRPASSNGYALSTTQLHQLLTGDQLSTCHDPFEKAVKKQQQMLVICNLLDHQNSIHVDLEKLLYDDDGAVWLDQQIGEFKSVCPAEILQQLMHIPGSGNHSIEHTDTIQKNYFSLISEMLYTPLLTLTKLQTTDLTEQERNDWYEWCLEFGDKLNKIRQQIASARQFFSGKTFDHLRLMSKDSATQQQIEQMKKLFSCADRNDQNV